MKGRKNNWLLIKAYLPPTPGFINQLAKGLAKKELLRIKGLAIKLQILTGNLIRQV